MREMLQWLGRPEDGALRVLWAVILVCAVVGLCARLRRS
jgi:hypothetical protein